VTAISVRYHLGERHTAVVDEFERRLRRVRTPRESRHARLNSYSAAETSLRSAGHMTPFELAKRVGMTWFSVSLFAYSVLDLLGDNHGSRIGRAIVAGFFVALSTAPAYYWRLKGRSQVHAQSDR